MRVHGKSCAGHPGSGMPVMPEIVIDESTPLPHRVFHALRKLFGAQKQLMMRRLAEQNAHPGQSFMLWVLCKHEGASQRDLAEALGIAAPTVTVMLKKMERAGLVERRPDENDHRCLRVYLTDAGRELHGRLGEVHEQVIGETIGVLSEADQQELERLLLMVLDNCEARKEG